MPARRPRQEGDDVDGYGYVVMQGAAHSVSQDSPSTPGLWLPNGQWHDAPPPRRKLGY